MFVLLLWFTATGPPLDVRPETGVQCPQVADVQVALRARLTPSAGPAWSLAYAETPGRLSVVLRAPDGGVRLTRTIDLGGSCAEAAEALAVMVARYFEELGWAAPARLPPPPGPGPPRLILAGPAPPRLILAAGPAGWAHAGWRLRGEADARLRLVGPLWLGLGALLPGMSRTETLGPGRAALQGWGFRASPLLSLVAAPRWRVGGGPEVLLTLESARSEGIAVPASDSRVGVGLGLGTHASFSFTARWQGRLEAAVHRTFGSEFSVRTGGGARRVLELPTWQAIVALKVAAVIL
jgi:hypothetical protein